MSHLWSLMTAVSDSRWTFGVPYQSPREQGSQRFHCKRPSLIELRKLDYIQGDTTNWAHSELPDISQGSVRYDGGIFSDGFVTNLLPSLDERIFKIICICWSHEQGCSGIFWLTARPVTWVFHAPCTKAKAAVLIWFVWNDGNVCFIGS